jgi:hypothetical protein
MNVSLNGVDYFVCNGEKLIVPGGNDRYFALKYFEKRNDELYGYYQEDFLYGTLKKQLHKPVNEIMICQSGYHFYDINNINYEIGTPFLIEILGPFIFNKGKNKGASSYIKIICALDVKVRTYCDFIKTTVSELRSNGKLDEDENRNLHGSHKTDRNKRN